MPGGPVASGTGIGGYAPGGKLGGILMTAFAAFGGILYGYDTGTISGLIAMQDWIRTFGTVEDGVPTLSASRTSLVVSILSAGTFVGALLGAPAADHLGRRVGIMVACLVFSIGIALQTGGTTWATFNVGRVIAGIGVGLVSTLIPMYQSECSPKWIRGAVVAGYQWAITIGLLLAAVVNNATKDRQDHSAWRIPISIQFIWAAVLVVGMFWLPESPRWLIKQGRDDEATMAMARLLSQSHTDPEISSEIAVIQQSLREERELEENSYLDCFRSPRNKIFLRTLTGILIQAMQQLTGINFIFYFGTRFFEASGVKNPFLISVATNIVNVFMTLPGMWGVERFGRRPLLLWGAVLMCICEYAIAIIGVTISVDNRSGQNALIALVCVYIGAFASTWGPIGWIIIGEIFPLNVRAKAMSLSVASNWLLNWAIAFATPHLVETGKGNAGLGAKVFFIWGTACLGCVGFTYFCVPETQGLSLEQIDMLYHNTVPWRSVRYRNQLLANDMHYGDVAGKRPDSYSEDVELSPPWSARSRPDAPLVPNMYALRADSDRGS